MNFLYFAVGLIDNTKANLPTTDANSDTLQTILNTAFIIIGAVAFLLMVIAGFRYVIARGDPQKIATVKSMIVYTAVGLIVTASAAAIVNLVIGRTG